MEQQELPLIMEAKQNDTATLENNVAVDHKTKHTLTKQVCNHAPLNLLLFGPFMLLLVDLSSLASYFKNFILVIHPLFKNGYQDIFNL